MHEILTPLGWILMVVTWGTITGLNVYCFYKIFEDTTDEIPDPLPSLDKTIQDHSVSQ